MADQMDEVAETQVLESQTQPDVEQYVQAVFGDGDDSDKEDDMVGKGNAAANLSDDDSAGELNDSDDEEPAVVKTKVIGKLKKKSLGSPSGAGNDDSPSPEEPKKPKKIKKKRNKEEKEKGSKKKRPRREKEVGSHISDGTNENIDGRVGQNDDGDAYDSGDAKSEDDNDRNFIADEDDAMMAGVVGEYNAEDQNFDDEAPMGGSKKKKGKKGDGGIHLPKSKKDMDPLTATLVELKRKKVAELSESEKQTIVTDLLKKMDQACKRDDAAYANGQPALNKLNLLKKVEEIVSVRSLQNTLLDYDVLGIFSEWINIKRDRSLPSHAVRLAVLKTLEKLPCETHHLKRKSEGSNTIGQAVVALMKHKQETRENKVLIKKLIEKWSRSVYSKQVDPRNASVIASDDVVAIASQYQQQKNVLSYAMQAQRNSAIEGDGDDNNDLLQKATEKAKSNDGFSAARARCPISRGFVFTVRPESNVKDVQEPNQDEGRAKILKRVKDVKGVGAFGKKVNPRAMDMAATGRDKLF